MSIFITSDEHYGHERIISLAHRPFKSVEGMNETIIYRHNCVVPNNHSQLTIHVGDLFWNTMSAEEAIRLLGRLNGKHALVYGNHDELVERSPSLREKFEWITGTNKASGSEIIKWNKHKITLNHYAQRVWDGSHKGHWHVYGHSHAALPGIGKSFDIGVDGHSYFPWSLEEIEQEMEKREPHHTIDNTGSGAGVDKVNDCVNCERMKRELAIEMKSLQQENEFRRQVLAAECDLRAGCKTCGNEGSCLDCLRIERGGCTVHASDCECGWCLMGNTRLRMGL